jgi:membrane-associated HD superfamily phosphohydrolase
MDIADRLALPHVIKQFIAEHHGTMLMEFFYRDAERRAQAGGGPPPVEAEYRYPGPKPHSLETALVMLADAAEGATRSLSEHTADKLQATVHEMVMKRLLDGQLDRSGLTLNDLHKIEETLTKTLLSVYHGRVSYPPQPEAGGTAEGGEAGRQAGAGGDPSAKVGSARTSGSQTPAAGPL